MIHDADFKWYLENIYPESQMPLNYYSLGEVRNIETNNCLDTFGRKSGENIAISRCHGLGGNQVFAYTKRKQIMSDDNCMDASGPNAPIKLVRCHGMGGNQMWIYDEKTKHIIHKNSGWCLERADAREGDPTQPKLRNCNVNKRGQAWIMVSNFKWQSKGHDGDGDSKTNNDHHEDNNNKDDENDI